MLSTMSKVLAWVLQEPQGLDALGNVDDHAIRKRVIDLTVHGSKENRIFSLLCSIYQY
jgi:hypothetical protein